MSSQASTCWDVPAKPSAGISGTPSVLNGIFSSQQSDAKA